MLVKELMQKLNDEASKLNGTKILDMGDYHTLMKDIFNSIAKDIEFLEFGGWGVNHKDFIGSDKPIRYNLDLKEDKRYRFKRRGTITRAYFELIDNDEVENLTIDQWNFFIHSKEGYKQLSNIDEWLRKVSEEKKQAMTAREEVLERFKKYLVD